jgi:two-component system cell cycle sensor histidine kinase/response regulator CckA
MTLSAPEHDITILYVEDEAATMDQVHRMLTLQGYNLILAGNGREGLDLYRTHSPDIVLTDIMMPFMNGLDMAREIRTMTPDAQIIIMTAFSDTDFTLQAIDIGVNQFVIKPVSFLKLFEAISRCIDIVKMQRILKEQHERIRILSNALEQSPSIALITDTAGTIEYVNRKFCDVTGFSAGETIGKTPRIIKSGETPQEVYRTLWDTILSGKEWHGTLQNRRKDGEAFWEYVSISPLKGPDGELIKFIRTGEDITELRKLEAKALKAEKMEATGILAGGMAHDFNNLLQVILGYLSLIKLHADSPTKILEMLDIIEKSSQQAKELSHRLLVFASSGEFQMNCIPLASLITSVVDVILVNSPVTHEYKFDPDLHNVNINNSLMERLFSSLATNAIEAMPQGGVLQIDAENLTIPEQGVLSLPAGEYAHITFHDTGIGIAPENLPKIFDPYFTTKQMGNTKGLGLGLALCHSIIHKHRGEIIVESTVGNGTTFHIYLPAAGCEVPDPG